MRVPDDDSFRVSVPGVDRLSDPARRKLEQLVNEQARRALDEASRLEANWRADEANDPEITARDIEDAFRFTMRVAPKKRTPRQIRLDVVAFAMAFVGGVFGNNIATPVGAVGFAVCALIGILAYTNRGAD